MSSKIRNILIAVFAVLLLAVTVTSYVMGVEKDRKLVCKQLNIIVLDSAENKFVQPKHVKEYIDKEYGTYLGEPLDSIDLARIESIIDNKSAVYKSQAYITPDGTLNVSLRQRQPVVRFQSAKGGFYADREGYLFPLQASFASNVQIIDGEIPFANVSDNRHEISDPKAKRWFNDVISLINYLEDSRLWKGKIVQIHSCRNGELILIPLEGNEKFLFGTPVSIEDKMTKMEKYYTHILPQKGSYKKVDLRFEKQIVCSNN